MALITAKDVSLAYDSNIVASDINFKVNDGDYLCIVGENGSGKSTLMKALLGLMKVNSGEIAFGDGLKQTEIGYLPQMSGIQKDFPASCSEVVLSGTLSLRGFKPFYSKKEKEIAYHNMDLMGISGFKKRSFRELSGGQQQRVLLARALSSTKKLIVLDEPVTGLDPRVTNDMYSLIKKINQEMGITVIMVSHDLEGALDSASHILHLHQKVLFFGTKDEYIKSSVGRRFMGGEQ